MKFGRSDRVLFFNEIGNKNIICFGTSAYFEAFCGETGNHSWIRQIVCFVDNRTYGTEFSSCGFSWEVKHPDILKNMTEGIIVICVGPLENIYDIVMQLQQMEISDAIMCYSLKMVMSEHIYDNSAIKRLNYRDRKINKVIHSFWFSKEKKPQKYQECMDSWKRFCPDFEIKEWNADNYNIEKSSYMMQAYDKKMWAFVSDYARLDVVYQYGGIYLDMDVELLKPIDELLSHSAFFAFDSSNYVDLGTGFGAIERHMLVGRLLKAYQDEEFIYDSEKPDIFRIKTQPAFLLPVFEEFGFERNNTLQIKDDVVFYSPDYFRVVADMSHESRDFRGNEYAVHWHHAGWFDQETFDRRENRLEYARKLSDIFK